MNTLDCRTLVAVVAFASVCAGLAAPGEAREPSSRPGDTTPPEGQSRQPVQDSDDHRIVGKVVRIDRDQKVAALSTAEGVVSVEVPHQMIGAIREGDTISVPRSAAESPSASPRESR